MPSLHPVLQRFRSQLSLFAGALLVLLCPLLVILQNVHTHNQQLDLIAQRIDTAPLPAQTTVLSRNAYVANLGGSGNACDYVAEQTMQTARTHAELLAFYQVTQGPSAEPIGRGIALAESAQYYRTEIDPWLVHLIIPDRQASPRQLIFLLQIMDGRGDAGFDLRCL